MIRRIAVLCAAVALALSAAPARAQIILGEMHAGEAHFEIEGGHILLQAMLNGRGPYAFYFDTGATSVLTPEVATELGLAVKGGGFVVGFGRAHPLASGTSVSSVKIGDFPLSDQPFEVVDLPHLLVDRGNRPKLAGLIGGDFLPLFVAHIDFDTKTIGFMPASEFSYSGGGAPVDLTLSIGSTRDGKMRERPFLPATLDDTAVTLALDTGSGGQATIFPSSALADALRAKPGNRLRILGPGGVGGGAVAYDLIRTGSFKIGPIPSPESEPTVDVMADGLGYKPRKSEVGVLGLAAFAAYNLTIDYSHSRLYLEPRAKAPASFRRVGYRGTGLELTKNVQDRFEVLGVIAGSPAEKAGIAAGDEILAIDGRPAADLAYFDYGAAEHAKEPSLSVTLGPESRRRTLTIDKAVLLP